MKVRGHRRCVECGERWSYFETGSVECPACGSVQSVGTDDERRLHTDAPAELDLSEARSLVDERSLAVVADAAGDAAREYSRKRGFVNAGELLPLDDTVVAAAELRHAASTIRRSLDVADDEELYFLDLLRRAPEGGRPDDVPANLRSARGLGAVDVVEAYRRDVDAWLEEHPDRSASRVLERLRDHEKRIAALDGDVPPSDADSLVAAARELGTYLREGEETALTRATDHLSSLE